MNRPLAGYSHEMSVLIYLKKKKKKKKRRIKMFSATVVIGASNMNTRTYLFVFVNLKLSTLSKIFSRRHIEIVFLFFFRKQNVQIFYNRDNCI